MFTIHNTHIHIYRYMYTIQNTLKSIALPTQIEKISHLSYEISQPDDLIPLDAIRPKI